MVERNTDEQKVAEKWKSNVRTGHAHEAESLSGSQKNYVSVPLLIHFYIQMTVCKEARKAEDGQRAYPKSL